jgi:hypothetical protein
MKIARFCDAQIMGILKQAEDGVPVSQLCREHRMSSAGFYKWRAKFGTHAQAVWTCWKSLWIFDEGQPKLTVSPTQSL